MHRTPRTLSECRFEVGYPSLTPRRWRIRDAVYPVVVFLCMVLIGVMLSYGV